jgi:hypothetical protein
MYEPAFDREDTRLLFEVLFDIRRSLAAIAGFVEGGEDDDGEEEEEEPEGPDEAGP